jgi:hypothetical protein
MEQESERTRRLLTILDEMIDLFERYEEAHWNERVRAVRRLLLEKDPGWRQEMKALYESDEAGRFRDLFIGPENGHAIELSEVTEVNRRFQVLREQVYAVAQDAGEGTDQD